MPSINPSSGNSNSEGWLSEEPSFASNFETRLSELNVTTGEDQNKVMDTLLRQAIQSSPQEASHLLEKIDEPAQGSGPYGQPGANLAHKFDSLNPKQQTVLQSALLISELAQTPQKEQAKKKSKKLDNALAKLDVQGAKQLQSAFLPEQHSELDRHVKQNIMAGIKERTDNPTVKTHQSTGKADDLFKTGTGGRPVAQNVTTRGTADEHAVGVKISGNLATSYGTGMTGSGSTSYTNVPEKQESEKEKGPDGGTTQSKRSTHINQVGKRDYHGNTTTVVKQAPDGINNTLTPYASQARYDLAQTSYSHKQESAKETASSEVNTNVSLGSGGVDGHFALTWLGAPNAHLDASALVKVVDASTSRKDTVKLGGVEVTTKLAAGFSVGGEAAANVAGGEVKKLDGTVQTGGSVEFDAFAGARASLGGTLGVGGFEASLTGQVWAGTGVVAQAYVGHNNKGGAFSASGELGAAFGYGGAIAWGVTVNLVTVSTTLANSKKIADSITEGMQAFHDWKDDSIEALRNDPGKTMTAAVQPLLNAGGNAYDAVYDVATNPVNAAYQAGQFVKATGDSIYSGVTGAASVHAGQVYNAFADATTAAGSALYEQGASFSESVINMIRGPRDESPGDWMRRLEEGRSSFSIENDPNEPPERDEHGFEIIPLG